MALLSRLLQGDKLLESAANVDAAHIKRGAVGLHVVKIQLALKVLDDAKIAFDGAFGPATASALLAYKTKRNIVNTQYQTKADDIAGKMTVAALDQEMLEAVVGGQVNPSLDVVKKFLADVPVPVPPAPAPAAGSITVKIEGKVEADSGVYFRKVIDPVSAFLRGLLVWKDIDFSYKFALFKVEKDGVAIDDNGQLGTGKRFWVIAIVPDGTNSFDRVHVFFHPTPTQIFQGKPRIVANDDNYEVLGGDWKGLGKRYRELVGPQLSAAKKFPLLVPLMRNSAANSPSALNDVFFDKPMPTLLAILKGARDHLSANLSATTAPTSLPGGISSGSFSSGIAYQANFLKRFPGQVLEAIDFDSTFIRIPHPDISSATGIMPVIKRHTQKSRLLIPPLDLDFPIARWDMNSPKAPAALIARKNKPLSGGEVHHLIIDNTFFTAMTGSLILST